ncbi:hypothetical protein TGAMA5MH_08416 [Trichoderma gamsii]|uniref:Carrier domain-containing protein n=1 Tax=Trichoderma gamsii TaxID=398673 RepID=A0A2K0T263_9HYPO|nr:hypothetical protein TGAMA5MH_08416 [Trichoderma gamsii]
MSISAADIAAKSGLSGSVDILKEPKDENGNRGGSIAPELILFSANNLTSLNEQIKIYSEYAMAHPELISDIAYTRAIRQEPSKYRAFTILGAGAKMLSTTLLAETSSALPSSIVMIFNGQGAQWAGMGKELLQLEEFKNDVKGMDTILRALKNPPTWTIEEEMQRLADDPLCRIESADIACMLSIALQIGLVHQFDRVGVKPKAVVGHSSGEIAAAYAAGLLTLDEAVTVAYYYGYVAGMCKSDGAMAVTGLSAEDTAQFLRPGVVVACENSPTSTTISGDRGAVEEVVASIHKSRPQVVTRKLHVNTAFHSQHMELLSGKYLALLEAEQMTPTEKTSRQAVFVSSVSNGIIGDAIAPSYWATNLTSPVRFSSAVESVLNTDPNSLFLEIGPHSALSSPLSQICNKLNMPCKYVSSQSRGSNCHVSFLSAVGRLWQASVALNLDPLFTGKAISELSQYPWNYTDYSKESLSAVETIILSPKDKRSRLISEAASIVLPANSAGKVPKTELELVLRALWADILRNVLQVPMADIGRQHNFFSLGGDSLTTAELVTAAYRHGIRLSPADIVQNPELWQMAAVAHIDEAETSGEVVPFSLIQQDGTESLKIDIQHKCGFQTDSIEDIYPCTPLQEGFLALGLKQPGSYVHRQVYRLEPRVDIERFVDSWNKVIKSCGSLRSRILLLNSSALQVVNATDEAWEHPVSGVDVATYLHTIRSIPMSYGDRLSRYTMLYQDDGEVFFIWIVHHAVFDGLSMKIVLNALHKVYNGAELALSPYSNFIRYIKSVDSNASSLYWRKEMEGAQRSQFPAASTSVKSQDRVFRRSIPFQNPKASITAATIIRAAWALVLSQYCVSDDVCFGMTLSGRQAPVPELDNIPGPMIASVPVRVKIDREMPVSKFLQQLQSHAAEMVAHEQFGLQNIAKLGPNAKEACDFANLLVIQPIQHLSSTACSALDAILQQGSKEMAISEEAMKNYFNYPLVLQAWVGDGFIDLHVTYYEHIMVHGQVEALANHFEHVTQQLLGSEDVSLRHITGTSSWDIQRAIEYNNEEPDIISSCIHQVVEEHAREHPDTMAVCAWDMKLSYSQLNIAANRLASYLHHDFAVKQNDIVHVCFEKTVWFFVSVLAINKAGAAWAPLDPSHPIKRQQEIVSQTKAKLVLTSPNSVGLCHGLVDNVIEVSSTLDETLKSRQQDSQNLHPVSPNAVAYVLFTSGSTGTPKGLAMQHKAACTSQTATVKRVGMTRDARMLQFASFVFDMSVGEMLGPWIAGACIYVPSEETRMNGLADYIRSMDITWMYLTPSFSRTVNPDTIPGVQVLVLGGEMVGRDILNTWFGKVRLINGWGPTETCVFSTLHEWTSLEESSSTIGRPVGGFCWITEDSNRLAPIGAIGEIVIQGPTILKEYLSDSAKTEAAITESLPDWMPKRHSEGWNRLYKTGDLGKYNPDGTIEFVSRKDTQIKIRGLRVELGEIEYQLKINIEGASQIMVDKITTEVGSSLVAFFSFSSETRMMAMDSITDEGANDIFLPLTSDLKSRIASTVGQLSVTLPRYMIPSFFIECRYMPSVSSTKLNRRMLKRLAESLDLKSLSTYSLVKSIKNAPETAMESRLQAIWAKRLNVPLESIGRDDSFLELGGDSIAVIHFVAEARQATISLTVKDVFDDPRLWKVASIADNANSESDLVSQIPPFSLLNLDLLDTNVKEELLSQCGITSWNMIEDAFPCLALQEGLMAMTAKQRGAYIAKMVFKIAQNVDIDHLKASWERTVAICSNLRTRILALGDRSIQIIVKEASLWENTDGLSMDAFLKRANDIHMTYGTRLSRFALVRDASGDKYFISIMHHSIFDGWSLDLMVRAFSAIYHGNNAPRLDSYSRFVKYALDADSKSSESYWTTQLSGASRASFPLPMDGMSAHKSEKKMGVSSRDIDLSPLTNSSITRATYLRAAWAILLARYCDTDDVCFGVSVSGRNAPGAENVLGLVVSTLPIRVRLDPNQTLLEFLHNIHKQSIDMVAHEQFGLQKIAKLNSEAKEACNFSSLFVIQPKELVSSSSEEEAIFVSTRAEQRLAWQSMTDYFSCPLIVQCHLNDDTVDLELVYDTAIISEFQVQALHNQLDHVVQQLISSSEEKMLRNVSIAGPWDLQQAMDWNAHDIVVEQDCLHDAVSRQAESCPDDEALYSTEFSLTYASLDRLSNHVAYQLLQHGIQPESIVPFCMEKSIWTVVAMVGIMKAGGAFMPLDPSHPKVRTWALVKEVNASVMICSPSTAQSCGGMVQGIIEVSASLLSLPFETPVNYQALSNYERSKPQNAAYVIYTSGSSGKPKGIVMPHSAICTALFRQPEVVHITKTSRVFQFSSYAFDGCIIEIFAALITGATVCVPTDTERLSSTSQFMTQARVTLTFLTPSFIKTIDPETVPTLITLCAAGEVPTKDIMTTWHGRVELFNLYGPAETCVMCSAHCWTSPSESPTTAGRPYAHHLFIVEPNNMNRLAPIGCIGELVVEGHAIARGYINNEEKTNAAFVSGLEWMLPTGSTKAYRTGDLAKFNSDGSIQILGRRDTQVKLRGQRIELGEIEHRIMSELKGVRYAVADVVEREAGKMLIAFVTLQNHPRPATISTLAVDGSLIFDETVTKSLQALVQNLRLVLPSYMIPSVVIPLWDMPHNASQKIDRRVLRELVAGMSQETLSKFSISKRDQTLPTTELELRLRDLWAHIIKVDPESISKFDNFLEIGGDSISAIVLSNLAAKEGLILPIVNIFKNPQLASMAASITSGQATSFDVVPFEMIEETTLQSVCDSVRQKCSLSNSQKLEDLLPCTPLQEGLMALAVKQPGSYIAKRVYRLVEAIDIDHFMASWEHTVQLCSNLRTRIIMNDRTSLQAVVANDMSWDETGDLSLLSYLENEFEMEYGSRLSRYAIVSDSNGSKYFVWTAHHAVIDGWTIQINLDTLQQVYNRKPAPTLQPYANFINYIRQLDQQAAANYWLSELEGAQRPAFPPASSPFQPIAAEASATRVLNTRIVFPSLDKSSITKPSVLRAAWAIVLGRYSDTDDVCFGVTTSGRQAPVQGLSEMTGPAICTLPVRIRLDQSKRVSTFLQEIQAQATEMIAHEQFGLQNVSKLSASAKDSCDFNSLLVIQPNEIKNLENDILTPIDINGLGAEKMLGNYFSYPFVVECSLLENHVDLMLVYKSDILTERQLQGLCSHFEHVVSQLLDEHDNLLGHISLTSDWDVNFARSANCDEPVAINQCIHHLIEQRAQMHPSSIAIDAWDGQFTYSEMDDAANRLANHLVRNMGVQVGDLVLVCFDKSSSFIIATLAINKSGAAWVPLDPSHPAARHESIAMSNVLEIRPQLNTELALNQSNETKLAVSVSPRDLAYIIFTSGSTGTPKGVAIQHDSLSSSQTAFRNRLGMDVNIRTLQFASYVFDASVAEIVATLLAGGCVCIPSWAMQMTSLATYIREAKVTFSFLTPSFARTISPEDVPCLETLILGGEAIGRDVFEKWFGKLRLFSAWGPTETTVIATLHEWESANESHLTIGRPITAYCCWIVDPKDPQKLAPTGTLGEIVVQGPALMREYLLDQEKTASAIVTSLPAWVPNRNTWGRFYKTGDLAVYNSDGSIRYSSRKDNQVKIRGLRIELGDIEHHISNNLNEVSQVAVDVSKRDAATVLVAFICFSDDTLPVGSIDDETAQNILLEPTPRLTASINTLVGRLNVVLPTYMVPTLFIPCKAMPLVASSKLDRKMLVQLAASLDQQQFEMYSLAHGVKVSPATDMERRLREIWAEILNMAPQSIGRDDSFLKIGGDSIAAIRLIAAARSRGIELVIGDIFSDPRLLAIASKARHVEVSSEETSSIKPFELLSEHERNHILTDEMRTNLDLSEKMGIYDAYPCSRLQEGLLALAVKHPGSYITSFQYRLSEHVDIDKFRNAWQMTVQLCGILRTRIVRLADSSIQVLVTGDKWDDTTDMTLVSYLQSIRKTHVDYGSQLCRYALIQEKKNETHFVLTMHHAIFDGWSMKIFFNTLRKAFNGLETPSLAPYSRFIQYTMNIDHESASKYWTEQLCKAEKASFPPTRSGMTNRSENPRSVRTFVTDIELPDISASGITRATILRATWALLLARYCDTDDVCFGTTISGRQAPLPGIMDMAGPAIATVPLRIRLDRQKSVLTFLQNVQEQGLAMVEFEQFGIQEIRKLSSDAFDSCDFSSLFVIQPKEALESAGGFEGEDPILVSTDQALETGEYTHQNYFSYPLVVQGHLNNESAQLVLIYDSEILHKKRIVALSHHFQHVAKELVVGIESSLGAITVASSWDLRQSEIFNSEVPEAVDSCFHTLVEMQAARTPNATALCAWDGSFTYAELDHAANRLAHHLMAKHTVKLDEVIHSYAVT